MTDEARPRTRCVFEDFAFEGGSFGPCPVCGSDEAHVRIDTARAAIPDSRLRAALDADLLHDAILEHQNDREHDIACHAGCAYAIARRYAALSPEGRQEPER